MGRGRIKVKLTGLTAIPHLTPDHVIFRKNEWSPGPGVLLSVSTRREPAAI